MSDRTTNATAALMAWVALALPLAAQEPSPAPPAETQAIEEATSARPTVASAERFMIESVEVEGAKRESVHRIVASESRIAVGREYGEDDIRLAVRRVKRLAFLLDARPVLRRGSAPGRYRLVFEVEEDSRVSVSLGAGFYDTPAHPSAPGESVGGRLRSEAVSGGLWFDPFLGSQSQLTVGLTGLSCERTNGQNECQADPHVSLGYREHNLLEQASRLDVRLNLARNESDFGGRPSESRSESLTGELLRPIGGDRSLAYSVSVRHNESRYRANGWTLTPPETVGRELEYDVESRSISITAGSTWILDTTDDLFAPTAGRRISGGARLSFSRRTSDATMISGEPPPWRLDGTRHDWGIEGSLSAFQVVPIRGRWSVAFHGSTVCGNWAESAKELFAPDSCFGSGSVALRFVQVGRRNAYRLHADAGVATRGSVSRYERASWDFVGRRFDADFNGCDVWLGARLRTRLAIVALSFAWRWD